MRRPLLNDHSGQTTVEYILLLMVVLLITFSTMERVRAFFLPATGECRPQDRSLACAFQRLYDVDNLKFYRFPR
jgi:hypothetical protein